MPSGTPIPENSFMPTYPPITEPNVKITDDFNIKSWLLFTTLFEIKTKYSPRSIS